MGKLNVIKENPIVSLLNGNIDILLHSVTCKGVLAVGIAKEIGITLPVVDRVNWRKCREFAKMEKALLGDFSYAYDYVDKRKIGVFNLYGQVEPGPFFDKSSARTAVRKALMHLGTKKRSGLPIKYGITLIGTEFSTIPKTESINLIEEILWELEYNKELVFDLTIFDYEG